VIRPMSISDPISQVAAEENLIAVPLELLEALVDDGECRFDHHGGCQEHGYLSLEPGDACPQADLKALIADAVAMEEPSDPDIEWGD
jgi:hypothetical protein